MKENSKSKTEKNKTKGTNGDFNIPDAPTYPGENNTGINNPAVELPTFNPPVPNRAWTAMKADMEIDMLSEEEKRNLTLGRDGLM